MWLSNGSCCVVSSVLLTSLPSLPFFGAALAAPFLSFAFCVSSPSSSGFGGNFSGTVYNPLRTWRSFKSSISASNAFSFVVDDNGCCCCCCSGASTSFCVCDWSNWSCSNAFRSLRILSAYELILFKSHNF